MIITIPHLYYSFLQNTVRLWDKILNSWKFGVESTLTWLGVTISSPFVLKVVSAPFFGEQRIVYLVTCDSFLYNSSSYLFRKLCKCCFRPSTGLFVQAQEALVSKNLTLIILEFKYFWKSSFVQKEDNVSYQFDLCNKYISLWPFSCLTDFIFLLLLLHVSLFLSGFPPVSALVIAYL